MTSLAAVARPADLRPRRTWTLSATAVLLVASITGLIALLATLPGDERQGSPSPPAVSAPRLMSYADPDGLFRISYPQGWRHETGADGSLVLDAGGQDAVSVKEFRLASRVDTQNLPDMRAVTDAVLSTPTAHLTVLDTQVVHLGPLTGLYYLYSFPSGNQQGVHGHYFLFSGNRMFSVVLQALPAADFPRLAKTFDAVAQSLVVTATTEKRTP